MKKIFFGMFIFLNCILSFAYEKKVIYSDTQLSILCDSEDFLGEICNQYYVKPGSFVTIKYKLNKYHSSGYDAVAGIGGAGGYYDEFYINKDIINTSQNVAISSEQIIEKELDKDITVALYRVRYSNSSSDSYECLSSITLRTSKEFYAKISNHNQGILYETKYPSGGCFDLFISIPKEGWCLCDLGICVRKNEFIEYKFEKKEVQYIDYVGKVGDTILEKGTQKIKVVNDFDIVVVKKISPPRGSLKEEELFTKKITVDGTAPEIEIKPSWEGKEWIQEDVEISAIDVKTGIKSFVVKKDGEEYKNNESGGNILLTEEGRYFITALDLVGNKKEIEINIDKTFPRITVNREPVKEDILYSDSIITIKAEDYGSGVAEFCVNGNTITGSEYTLTKSGNYTIFVKDKAGNESTRTIKIDNEKPTVTGRIEFKQENGSIKKIEIVDVKGEDKHSGIENTWVKNGTSTIGGEIKIEDRTKLNTYQIQIGAKDKAGNQVEKELAVINVPPKIKVSVDEESKRIIKENGEEYTATDLILDNYEKYAKYYKEIKLTKVIYVCDGESDKKIDDSNFNNYFSPEAQSYWQEITEEKVISTDEIKNGKYKDKIKTSSGFGHKETGYILSWEIEGIEGIRERTEEVKIQTANSEGNVKIQIIGKEDDGEDSVLDISFIDGKAKSTDGELKIPADGSIYIAYTVEDKDSEPYEIEVREKVKVNGRDEYLIVAKEGFLQKGNTGYSVYGGEKNPNDYAEGVWFRFSNPEYLAYNKVTCLVIRVKEGYGSDAIDKELGEIYLKAEPLDLGGFKLQVSEEADYNFFGITASPFQNVQIEVEGIDSITWDFGDDCVEKSKKIVTHAWSQSPERKGSVSEYILKLTQENEGNDVEVPIHIVDTKAGALYGDEVWIGEHEILGPVIVPNGKTLTIGRKTDSTEEINILCIEDSNEKYMGSIEVSNGGKLKINNGTEKVRIVSGENTNEGIVEETEEDISYWKGIRIKDGGKAEIENTEIMGSKRGVAVEKGASLIIKESLLSKNEIGLHVFGSCEIEDVEIAENKEYGIKEEKNCEEITVLGTNKITENEVDWYDWNSGVLTEEEIENKKARR